MRHPFPRTVLHVVLLLAAGTLPAEATSFPHNDVVDLIGLSELILAGRVTAVTDGFENGVPYTQVTLDVREALKGRSGSTYTFRQFGLKAPRRLEDGRTYLGITPDGWPRYQTGEDVLLFLYLPGNRTGLRTTVGLLQGKFVGRNGSYLNGIDNQGLFRNVSIDPGLLSPAEKKMLAMKAGPIRGETLTSFVKKAVQGGWIENRKLSHVR